MKTKYLSNAHRRELSEAGLCSDHPSRKAVARYRSKKGRVVARCAECDQYWKDDWMGPKPSGDEWQREDLTTPHPAPPYEGAKEGR